MQAHTRLMHDLRRVVIVVVLVITSKNRCFEVVEGNYSQSDQTENYFFYNTIYTLMFSAMQSGGSFGRSRTTNGNLSKAQQLFLGDTCKPNCIF